MTLVFKEKLQHSWDRANSFLCVGLDPILDKFPQKLQPSTDDPEAINSAVYEFCRSIVDSTHEFVCAYKPQIAHFSVLGAENVLKELIAYIHQTYPGIPVILDAKRGDIGSTAQMYAKEAFVRYGADAATVNPYLGWDSIRPFTEYMGKGAVVLCHTSNPDGSWLQEYPSAGKDSVFMRVAEMVAQHDAGNMMLVMGATFPDLLGLVRRSFPDIPFLVPGIGVQGGDIVSVMKHGRSSDGYGLVINSSRGIIYSSSEDDYAEAARESAKKLTLLMPVR